MSDVDLQEVFSVANQRARIELTTWRQIRKARLAQLQSEGRVQSSGRGGALEEQQKQQEQEAEARTSILSQILLPEAADRLGRIRLVKESRAIDIENRLIMLAKTGQLKSKVTEDQLKELLGAVAENTQKEGGAAGKIVISRRKGGWDDDDDLLDL
ncbi:hypothetical protein MMC07_001868 [Pseudocyphellaria aurata]|nr:hypothetical protein [Pseudocyphellaria aurata]